MKTAKKIASLFFALALFVSMLTVSASAKDDEIKGNASETYKFTVKTGSRWGSNYVKLKQTQGKAPYKTFATILFEGDDATKDANLYGKYSVNVYDSNGEKLKDYSCVWGVKGVNDGATKKIKLGDNSTYTIEVVPWSVEDVFCAYIEEGLFHLNALRYTTECANYNGSWSVTPEWTISAKAGVKSVSKA